MTWGSLLKSAALAAVVTIVVNVLLALAARALIDIPPEFGPVSPLGATIATTMWMVMGIVALLLVARFAKKNPAGVYWCVSIVGFVLSFGPNVNLAMHPESFPGTTGAGMIFLAVQHVVGFAIFVPWVTRALRTAR